MRFIDIRYALLLIVSLVVSVSPLKYSLPKHTSEGSGHDLFDASSWWSESVWKGMHALGARSLFGTANMFGAMRVADTEVTQRVEVIRNLVYDARRPESCRLDVWRPVGTAAHGPGPAVMFVHGGGFRTMSKDTHWMMARVLARMGYVVAAIDYRLAPEHRFPGAIEDVCQAWSWMIEQGPSFGVDPGRIVLAGESAGANLSLSLALALSQGHPEPWALQARELGYRPAAVVAACGLLQVSEPQRLAQAGASWLEMVPIKDATRSYLGENPGEDLRLADPLKWLESLERLDEAMAPVFIGAGGKDPIRDDSRRLAQALARHGAPHQAEVYAGRGHSFMAFLWDEQAQQFWRDVSGFLADATSCGAGCEQAA